MFQFGLRSSTNVPKIVKLPLNWSSLQVFPGFVDLYSLRWSTPPEVIKVINIYTPPRGVLLRVMRNKRAKSTYAHPTNSQGPNQKSGGAPR